MVIKMGYTVEETLKSGDLPADVIPQLLWREFIEGARKRRVFLEPVDVTAELQGRSGTKVSVPAWSTRFSGTTISESSLDTSGYTPTDPAVTDTDVSIGNQLYVAFRLSHILREDQPDIRWLQLALRDSGRAIEEYRDAAVRDVLVAGVSFTQAAATYGTLDHNDIIDLLAQHKGASSGGWFPEDIRPFVYVHPDQEADLLKDTRFLDTNRYAVGDLPELGKGTERVLEKIYAGCRVRVTDGMTKALALVVFPRHPQFGMTVLHAVKRPMTIRNDAEELYGRDLWIASMRYGTSVIQADGLGLITAC